MVWSMVDLVDFKDKLVEGSNAVPTYGAGSSGGLSRSDISTAAGKGGSIPT